VRAYWAVNGTDYTLVEHLVTNDGCTANKIGIDSNSKPTGISVTICSGETFINGM
jgi:hypothetical protein